MSPKNDAINFQIPKSASDIDDNIYKYYVRQSYIHHLDADQDPSIDGSIKGAADLDSVIIKDVRAIHISSDH